MIIFLLFCCSFLCFHASVIFNNCSCFLFLFFCGFCFVSGFIFVIDSVASRYVCLGTGVLGSSCGVGLSLVYS